MTSFAIRDGLDLMNVSPSVKRDKSERTPRKAFTAAAGTSFAPVARGIPSQIQSFHMNAGQWSVKRSLRAMPTSPEAPNGSKFTTRTRLDFLLATVDCCDNGSDPKISCRVDFSTKIGSKSGTKYSFNSTSTNSRPPDAAAVWMVSPG